MSDKKFLKWTVSKTIFSEKLFAQQNDTKKPIKQKKYFQWKKCTIDKSINNIL